MNVPSRPDPTIHMVGATPRHRGDDAGPPRGVHGDERGPLVRCEGAGPGPQGALAPAGAGPARFAVLEAQAGKNAFPGRVSFWKVLGGL